MSLTEPKRFLLLDALRGVAAGLVMCRHLWLVENYFFGINMAVDFFFVLSGFILAPKLLQQGAVSTKEFIRSRVLRFYPMLIPVFLVLLITQKIPLISRLLPENHGIPLFDYLGAFLLLQVFYAPLLTPDFPLWSLSAEMFANVLAANFRSKKSIKIFILSGAMIELIGLVISHELHLYWGLTRYFVAIGRVMVGFNLGLILHEKMQLKHNAFSVKRFFWIAILIALLFVLIFITEFAVVFAPVAFFLLIQEVLHLDENRFSEKFKAVCSYLGRISFGIYVWHVVIASIGIPKFIISFLGIHLFGVSLQLFSVILTIIAVITATEISIRCFEIPIRRHFGGKKVY